MNCNTTHYRANSSSVPGDPTLRELAAFYTGQALPEVPIQYGDFAAWQRSQDDDSGSLTYWTHQLAGPLPQLDLSRLAGKTATRCGAVHTFTVPLAVTNSLRHISRREGATLFMALLAAFNALLARCSGQDDLLVGTPIANRTRRELEGLIGFFVNTLVIRSDLSGDPDFRELLRRTRSVALDAFEHQDLPFEQLVSALAPDRQLHRQPLFRVMFALQNAPLEPLNFPNLEISVREIDPGATLFDLTLQFEETPQGLAGTFQYDTGLFTTAAIESLAGDFCAVLQAVAENQSLPLHALPVSHASGGSDEVADSVAEVEAALLEDPAVADAVVLRRTTVESESRVVAYVVLARPNALGAIRARIEARLTEAIRPADWVSLSALPRTATGKVDHEALAAIPVVDSALAERAENSLRSIAGIKEAVALVADLPAPQRRLHLSELLPGWKRSALQSTEASAPVSASTPSASAAPAISDGPALHLAPGTPANLGESLEQAAQSTGGISFLEPETLPEMRSYADLLDEARRILGGLRERGLQPQDKVIFQFDRNADFIAAFWGCVLGGFVPVPVSPVAGQEAVAKKLQHVCSALPEAIVLTVARLAGSLPELGDRKILDLESLRRSPPSTALHSAQPDDLTLLMLTSGSTSAPKLVQLTHRNLLCRSVASIQMHGFTSDEVTLNWMPLDHVAGLVYFHLRDVMLGCRQLHAATSAVLESPLRWLDWLDEHRATITFAPNFAYALINERSSEIAQRHWDLSALRFVLNGAESIVAGTARRFVEVLAPHGLAGTAMHPAWGMAETSSGVTYADRIAETTPGFVEVGSPIPGFSIRIVDAENGLLRESEIGRLQVRGPTVTRGYLDTPEANREAFTSDGWFDTGDLGVLREDRLTITGRAKEVIIVNGVNYHSHEIESVVERVPGVRTSFTAAFAVRETGADTDQLAIVFSPAESSDETALRQVGEIRNRVAREAGVTPAWIVPVAPEEIPKTAIGKIQRAQLRQRFERGEFEDTLTRLDVLSANANTLPAWFYRRVWHRRAPAANHSAAPAPHDPARKAVTLLLTDDEGIGRALQPQLGRECVVVEIGCEFARRDSRCYAMRPAVVDDCRRLVDALGDDAVRVDQIVHLWTCDQVRTATTADDLDRAQNAGLFSVLALIQALAAINTDALPVRLLAASIGTQAISENETIAPERTPLLGLLRTIPRELPWLRCRHVDLPPGSAEANAARMLTELESASSEPEVAWREHRRLVPMLEPVRFDREAAQPLPFTRGCTCLITGGLGGIGTHVARYLLENFEAKILIVGRAPLTERAAALGGGVSYVQADVCDLERLSVVIADAEARWGRPLDGILHLAGTAHECALLDETRESIATILEPKLRGTWALQQILATRLDVFFISFSSVNALFGGSRVGAYAAANRFLESVAHEQRRTGTARSWCLAWSAWDGVGMNRGSANRELSEAHGYQWLSPTQALHSLAAALHHPEALAWIGLDGSNAHLQPFVVHPARNQQQLCAWFAGDGDLEVGPSGFVPTDRFGVPAPCETVRLPHLPRTSDGEIDRSRLSSATREITRIAPRTATERRIAKVWQEVLEMPAGSVHDNFFQAGGHSLLAAQLVARVNEAFAIELRLPALFEAPTIAGLAALVERHCAQPDGRTALPLLPLPRNEPLCLSFAQQRLWFLDQFERNRAVYNIPVALRLRGSLDVPALESAFREIVHRHEALRTTFAARGGEPMQIVGSGDTFALTVVDLQAASDCEAEARRLAVAEAGRAFDLAAGPLLRVTLLRVSATDHVLLLTLHHIVADGWSYGVFVRELSALYAAHLCGTAPALPELPVQYADYARWQRDWLESGSLAEQLAYWKRQLAGAPPALELPTDRPRPPVETFRGAWLPFKVSAPLAAALEELSQREGVTLFMTLLAVFQTLLHRYTGQTDIVVGSAIAGRTRPDLEKLIGFFANTLVLRTDLSGDPTLLELLPRVRDVATSAYAHQDLPFEKLVETLNPERDLSRHPIFQVMFSLQNTPLETPTLPGVQTDWMVVDPGTAMFDLNLFLEQTGHGLKGLLEYNTDLFDAATAERMIGHFTTLLETVVANPAVPLSRLPFLTEAERRQLLIDWNPVECAPAPRVCLHELFAAQARRTPEAVAVVCDDARLTYGELNTRANQLAHHLRSLGAGAGTFVGLYLDRSLDLVVGVLGILKAGGAYVPLDPVYPRERLALILDDARLPVLLTQASLAGDLPAQDARLVRIDTDWPAIAEASTTDPASGVQPEGIAYVIYTSGSTGVPKGVLVSHANVVRLFTSTAHWFRFDASDVWTLFHSIAFDFSVWELWGALLYGGRLVVVPYAVSRSPMDFCELLCAQEVTVLNQTPSAFRALIEAEGASGATPRHRLRLVVFGGEALDVPSLRPWFKRHGDQSPQLINMFGITETTVHVTYRPLSMADLEGGRSFIGRPLPDLSVYLLDAHLQPVPIGVIGEIHVGGAGVAAGYLNRPELTAERFVPDPFSTEPGARLYRSGDLARFLPDGDLVYLGRRDHQVKIRGFRIELGEIETVLAQHPGVRQAVATVTDDAIGGKRIAAYVVPRTEDEVAAGDLRELLKRKLPDYMVPATVTVLSHLPLTPSGKLDRSALPSDAIAPTAEAYSAPRDAIERQLAEIWEALLEVRPIGRNDDFFDLGGHSLLAVRLFAELERRLAVRLPIATLFRAPTLEALGTVIRRAFPATPASALIATQSAGLRRPIFWAPSVGAGEGEEAWAGVSLFHYRRLAELLGPDQPSYGFAPNQELTSFESLAEHCIQQMQTVQPRGPYAVAGYCAGGHIAFEIARQLHARGEKVDLLAVIEGAAPFSNLLWRRGFILGTLRVRATVACKWLAAWFREGPRRALTRVRRKVIRTPSAEPIGATPPPFLALHGEALRRYRPKSIDCKVVLFRGNESLTGWKIDPRLGWAEIARDVEIKTVPGEHLTILKEPAVQTVAEALGQYLAARVES